MKHLRRFLPALIALAPVVVLVLPASPAAAVGSNPYVARAGWVDPSTQSAVAARQEQDSAKAAALHKVAGQSQYSWFGAWTPSPKDQTARLAHDARAAGKLPQVVLYALPHLDCGAGGLRAAAYRTWVRELATGLRGGASVVVVEPDALAGIGCLPSDQQRERLDLLRDAVAVLRGVGATVYLDAGHAQWTSPDIMAQRLRAAGVAGARGVSLNVSNYGPNLDQIRYAKALAQRLPGLHALIDTSRNGKGGVAGQWCNVAGQALGERPRRTFDAVVDAFVWVKAPGESDGDCGRGEPAGGSFWKAYAVGLAGRSGW